MHFAGATSNNNQVIDSDPLTYLYNTKDPRRKVIDDLSRRSVIVGASNTTNHLPGLIEYSHRRDPRNQLACCECSQVCETYRYVCRQRREYYVCSFW